jgi:hypothetical protein
MVPEGFIMAAGASVGWTMAVGAVVPPVLGAEVGAEVGATARGVAVADDPQATNRNRPTINNESRKKPGFLKLWNIISEPPKFKRLGFLGRPPASLTEWAV